MSGIINWLRGEDKITIMTLLQIETDEVLPKVFAKRPTMAQWVLDYDPDKIMSSIQHLVGGIVTELEESPISDLDIEVEQNNRLRDQTPDCNLVVEIVVNGKVWFRVYLTGFVKSGSGGWK
tara:strand:- start:6964 stop:7326 length:363 start_codon:yes stop_codon:yes gene_type:complete